MVAVGGGASSGNGNAYVSAVTLSAFPTFKPLPLFQDSLIPHLSRHSAKREGGEAIDEIQSYDAFG